MKSLTDIEYSTLRKIRDREGGLADQDAALTLLGRGLVVPYPCRCGRHVILGLTALGRTAILCYEASRALQFA